MLPPFLAKPLDWIAAALLAGFVLAAAWEFRRAAQWPRRVWALPAVFCAGLAGLLLSFAALLLIVTPSFAWTEGAAMLRTGCVQIVQAFLFLTATLSLSRRANTRALPLIDRLAVTGRARRRGRALPPRAPWILAKGTAYLAGMLAFSYFWLALAVRAWGARIHPVVVEAFDVSDEERFTALVLAKTALIVLAPFAEEATFRGYIQGKSAEICLRWARRRGALGALARVAPAVLAALLWALMHEGMIEPDWAKWAQIFGVGLLLGSARRRLGLEGCIVLHLLFNVLAGGFFAPPGLNPL